MNESIDAGIPARPCPIISSHIPICGHTSRKMNPKIIENRNDIIGTDLVPPKNPNTVGSLTVWYLLYSQATEPPTTIPPNTEVTIDSIPMFEPTTEAGTSE